MKEEQLIFIVSQPRSGSTYLQSLLSNNNFVNTSSEHWSLLHFASLVKPSLVKGGYDAAVANDAFSDYLQKNPNLPIQEKKKEFLLSIYEPLAENYTYVIDKTPRYYEILDEILQLFPKSRILILLRDPVSVLKSIIRTWHIDSLKMLKYYERDILLAPTLIESFIKSHSDNKNVCVVQYEELVNNPQDELQTLMQWLNIPFAPEMLEIANNSKVKGKYGDPFQNPEHHKSLSKQEAKSFQIPTELVDFTNAYDQFFKHEKTAPNSLENANGILKRFLELPAVPAMATDNRVFGKYNEKLEQKYMAHTNEIKSSMTYKLGHFLLYPFKLLKNKF